MGKYRKFLLIFMITIIILNISSSTFANSSEKEIEEAEELGEKFGYFDGILEGLANYSKNSDINYNDIEPSVKEVTEKYIKYLENKDTKYIKYFLSAYYLGFERGFDEIFSSENSPEKTNSNSSYADYADALGILTGEIYGFRDYYENKNSIVNKSLPSNKVLIKMFKLDRLNHQDRSSFLNIFKEKFKEGYQEGYGKGNFEAIKVSYDEGVSHGEYFGNILGKTSGTKDYFENKNRDYERRIPSNNTIIREYSLNKDGNEYREGFLIGFRRAYEKSYNESFRTMNIDEHKRFYEEGYERGIAAGILKGEVKATADYYLKLEKNWRNHFSTQSNLIREYNLSIESIKYREGFFSGYLDGLAQGYSSKFQELSQETIEKKSKVEEVFISGGEIKSLDNILTLKIDKGTYYNPVMVTIDILPDSYYPKEKSLIKASNYYNIDIINKSNESENKKEIELKFEYYGKDNGGIYKLVNDKWLYIPSYVEDGFIKAFVKPSFFKGEDNIYCVFVDRNVKVLLDVRNHWAKEEISTYQRRGIVSGYSDNTFKPNNKISKGEFLTILSKVYNWELSNDEPITYKNLVDYATEKSYIDNSFNLDEGITYREIESIMEKVTNIEKFNWYNISAKILYEKQYKSKSYNNMNNYISRAEVVYMLYTLNEWRY